MRPGPSHPSGAGATQAASIPHSEPAPEEEELPDEDPVPVVVSPVEPAVVDVEASVVPSEVVVEDASPVRVVVVVVAVVGSVVPLVGPDPEDVPVVADPSVVVELSSHPNSERLKLTTHVTRSGRVSMCLDINGGPVEESLSSARGLAWSLDEIGFAPSNARSGHHLKRLLSDGCCFFGRRSRQCSAVESLAKRAQVLAAFFAAHLGLHV